MDCQGKKTKKEKIPSHLRRATYKLLDTRTPTRIEYKCATATFNSLCVSIRLLFFYSAVTLRACPALTWIQEYGKDHGAKGRGNRRERERKPFGSKVNLALCTHSFSVSLGLDSDTNRFALYQRKERPTCYLVKLDTLSTSDSRM